MYDDAVLSLYGLELISDGVETAWVCLMIADI